MDYKFDRRLKQEYQVVIIAKSSIELDDFESSLIKEIEIKDMKSKESNKQIVLTIKLFEELYMPIEILRELNAYLSKNNEGYCELFCSYSEIKGGF